MTKKIAIIGKGTAGCMSAAQFCNYSRKTNDVGSIEWYYDPELVPQSVGEGTTIPVTNFLAESILFKWHKLPLIDGNYKTGLRKKDWTVGGDFYHDFPPSNVSMHFNAVKLQNHIEEELTKLYKNITIKHQNITHDEIDADYIIDCTGAPQHESEEFTYTKYIPVNSVHVTQCFWEAPAFDYSITFARPYGWVWGIPLKNRCSIGYMYDNKINTLDEIKEDVKNIFEEFNLNPSNQTNSFSFRNYYRKENFTERVAYNGNASFFLEPLEATSIGTMLSVNSIAGGVMTNNISPEEANFIYTNEIQDIQNMINFHYFAGSAFKSDFWESACSRAKELLSKEVKTNQKLKEMLNVVSGHNPHSVNLTEDSKLYGNWNAESIKLNLDNLGIYDELTKLQWN